MKMNQSCFFPYLHRTQKYTSFVFGKIHVLQYVYLNKNKTSVFQCTTEVRKKTRLVHFHLACDKIYLVLVINMATSCDEIYLCGY